MLCRQGKRGESNMQKEIPCMILRGGTSKGVYLLDKDLPPGEEERNKLLLRLMGSPDVRQIDGLGGAASVTSKVAILAPSSLREADVNYTFAQVSVDKPVVSYAGNCGNISSGVGPFAIECGLVKANSPTTTVRVFNTNTNKLIIEDVQTPGGIVTYEGDYAMPGVPGTAAPVKVMVLDPAGSVCNGLLPTGHPQDTLDIPGFGPIRVSIIDAANPLVFIKAGDVGLTGKELPQEMDREQELLDVLERIRGEAAKILGFIKDSGDSAWKSPGVPKMALLSSPESYTTSAGEEISGEDIDLLARMMSMQKAHPTYALTGAMCTAAAAVIPGTLIFELKRNGAQPKRFRIGHPGGVLEAGVDYEIDKAELRIQSVYGYRTARLLMKGTALC